MSMFPSRAWAEDRFSKMSAQAQTDTREILAVLKTDGTKAATVKLLEFDKARDWPSWIRYAVRDIVLGLSKEDVPREPS